MKKLHPFRFNNKSNRFKVAALMVLLQQSKFVGLMDGRYSHSDTSSVAGALPDTLNFSGWVGPDEETWDYLVVDDSVLADHTIQWVLNECNDDPCDDYFEHACCEVNGQLTSDCILTDVISAEEFHAQCAELNLIDSLAHEIDEIQHTEVGC